MALGQYERVELSPGEKEQGLENIKQAQEAIEKGLAAIETQVNEQRRSIVCRILLVTAILLIFLGLLAILRGVFQGSGFKLIGEGGVGSFCIIAGTSILSWIHTKDWHLRTLVPRVRVRLATCMGFKEYENTYQCFTRALQLLNEGIEDLKLRVRSDTDSG